MADNQDIAELVPSAKSMFLSAFEEAYKNEPAFFTYVEEAFTKEKFEKEWQEKNTDFWIVKDKDQIIGYVKLKYDILPADISEGKGMELKRFYLEPAYHGIGLAQELMKFCLELAGKENCNIVWLGVWPQNHKAIKFYKKFNFQIEGEVKFVLGGKVEWDFLMTKKLA
ncbi:MAG: GNAT family N-acetyltransferase [Bacteroidia bacterium]|nr:GNAT family N-acetyltransferase [Bacteroidia bacterium]